MISFDDAIATIVSIASPLGTEPVPLERAARRVLAEPVLAQIDSPRWDVSAMDGYAVRGADLGHLPARLKVVGESFAGAGWRGPVAHGECVRIFTGAPVPPGADRVIMQENAGRDGDWAVIADAGFGDFIRKRGSDFAAGDELLPGGRQLDARAIVASAAADIATLQVFRQPRFHILSTGDELAAPGTARARGDAIPESVSLGVACLGEEWGAVCVGRATLKDDLAAMQATAAGSIQGAEVLVVTGGASVGEKDFAKEMYAQLGLNLLFSKVAIKPGKPVWLGTVGNRFVIGLPGNPTSALVTARLFLAPLLALLQGRPVEDALRWKSARLKSALPPCGERETFHRAVLADDAAEVLCFQDSSAQKALAEADILVRQRPNSAAIAAGEKVEILSF